MDGGWKMLLLGAWTSGLKWSLRPPFCTGRTELGAANSCAVCAVYRGWSTEGPL